MVTSDTLTSGARPTCSPVTFPPPWGAVLPLAQARSLALRQITLNEDAQLEMGLWPQEVGTLP